MRKPQIDHSLCDHPGTKNARAICRRERAGLPPPARRTRKHSHCDHPRTRRDNAACREVHRDERVWAEEGPIELEDITNPAVRAKVRRIAAEQEARLELRLLAAGLHVTQ